jgi:hypothetical protein
VYRITFDDDVYLRKVGGNFSRDNISWDNVSWEYYSTNNPALLSSMFVNKTIFDFNSDILAEPTGLGIAFKCGETKLKLNASNDSNKTNSLYLTKSVANPLAGFLKVLFPRDLNRRGV